MIILRLDLPYENKTVKMMLASKKLCLAVILKSKLKKCNNLTSCVNLPSATTNTDSKSRTSGSRSDFSEKDSEDLCSFVKECEILCLCL